MLPNVYKDDLDKCGMGSDLHEVIVASGNFLKHMRSVRNDTMSNPRRGVIIRVRKSE